MDGVDGYIIKDDSPEIILSILNAVAQGNKSFSPRIQTLLAEKFMYIQSPLKVLSVRELEVFKLITKGYKNKEIADELKIKLSTVEFHKKNIKEKLNARNITDLLNIAYKYHIL